MTKAQKPKNRAARAKRKEREYRRGVRRKLVKESFEYLRCLLSKIEQEGDTRVDITTEELVLCISGLFLQLHCQDYEELELLNKPTNGVH